MSDILPVCSTRDGLKHGTPNSLHESNHHLHVGHLDITPTPGQVFVGVQEQELTVQILKMDVSESGDLNTLHQASALEKVDPTMTNLTELPRGLTIALERQRNFHLMQLSRQKVGLIKKDPKCSPGQ